jgi:hypothetical protein
MTTHATAALRGDFEPDLPQMLGFIEPRQFERRLRDRIELEKLRGQTDKDLAELKVAAAYLAEHYEQPAPDDGDWLPEAATKALEREREAAHFLPVIAALKGALEPPNDKFEAEVQRLLRDSIEVLKAWLAFYRGLRAMLAKQATEWRISEVLRARPVEGDIDHEALSREFIARFPKIRAALAK